MTERIATAIDRISSYVMRSYLMELEAAIAEALTDAYSKGQTWCFVVNLKHQEMSGTAPHVIVNNQPTQAFPALAQLPG